MENFIDKLKNGLLKDGLSILNDINNKYNSYNKDTHCRCDNCNKFLNYISEFNKKRDLESYEKEESLYRKDLMRINHKVVNLDSLYDEDNLFLLNLRRLITLSSHDDWFAFGNYYYCEDCFSFYDITTYFSELYPEDENNYESFKSDISINCLDNNYEIRNLLDSLFTYLILSKIGDVYKEIDLCDKVYVYDRLEYDLSLDPLWSFNDEESKEDYIKNDIYYKSLNFDFNKSLYLNRSNSVKWESSGFCRLLIDEKDLVFDISNMSSGLSGFISGFGISILKEKVQNIEFYDILNDIWISFDSTELKNIIKNNNDFMSIKENKYSERFNTNESNLIHIILDYYKEMIEKNNLLKSD